MEPDELVRLAEHCASLSDHDLRDAYDVGSAAHQDRRVWEMIEQEYRSRELNRLIGNPSAVRWDAVTGQLEPALDPTEALKADSDPRGLRGWLILLALGLTDTVLRVPLELALGDLPLLASGTRETLTDSASAGHDSLWGLLIALDISANLTLSVMAVVALYVFFRRSPLFPRLATAVFTVPLVLTTVEYGV